jgi:non-ribosomal peptide synthetase component F
MQTNNQEAALMGEDRSTYSSSNFPKDWVFDDLLHEAVRQHADCLAVVDQRRMISFAGLDLEATRVARELSAAGVELETPVILDIGRSVDAVVAIFAVLKAGGFYVPLDSSWPDSRVAEILDEFPANVHILSHGKSNRTEFLRDRNVLFYEQLTTQTAAGAKRPLPIVQPANLAYAIFTSGSTGRPKGVLVEHGSLVNHAFIRKDEAYGLVDLKRLRCTFGSS